MTNKILEKHGVITSGAGASRVVLDYDSGLIYSYNEPESVFALYQSGTGWIFRKQPSYYRGAWGNASHGDKHGHDFIQNTKSLLNAISARSLELNVEHFYTQEEVDDHNSTVKLLTELARSKKLKVDASEDAQALELPKLIKAEVHNKGESLRGFDPIKEYRSYEQGLKVFLTVTGKKIQFKDFTFSINRIVQNKVTVAFRDSLNNVWLNSQVIQLSRFESEFLGKQSIVQREVRKIAKYSIPFNVLESAKLSLTETKVIEQGPESDHSIKTGRNSYETEQRHFTGALLLENNNRKFLMDIDRIEIEHKLFNVFFVEVDKSVNSIEQAYESMKPQEVKDAESKGIEVKRQGEWFFIATDKTVQVSQENTWSWKVESEDEEAKKPRIERRSVAHGKGRPNDLFMPFGFENQNEIDGLVCGTVSHQGREHADLDLGKVSAALKVVKDNVNESSYSQARKEKFIYKLWKLVGNTTVSNFTITGDVD